MECSKQGDVEQMQCMQDAAAIKQHVIESANKFGVELKDMQMKAVLCFVGGRDTFVSLPTGYGKSLIYGILPYVFDKLRG